jgi:hypothetical protein
LRKSDLSTPWLRSHLLFYLDRLSITGRRSVSFKTPLTISDGPPVPEWMHLEAVCREYPLSRAKLYRLSEQRRITIRKLGRRSVLRRSDVERLLETLPHLHPTGAADAA